MGISGQTIWRQTGNFLRKQKIIRKITYYEPGLSGGRMVLTVSFSKSSLEIRPVFIKKVIYL